MTRLENNGAGAAIARGLKERDPDAMAQLYDCCGALVYSRVYSAVQNHAIAEDLTQDVFLRVWERVQRFDETRGSLIGWVLGVTRNRCIDYLRSAENRLERKTSSIAEQPDSLLKCQNAALHFDLFETLRNAIGRLNANQQTVLRLAFEEGLSHSEVARKLKQPLGTVKSQIRSAIQYLRANLSTCPETAA